MLSDLQDTGIKLSSTTLIISRAARVPSVSSRFLIGGSPILKSASNSIGIEAILRKPGRKLISWLIRFTSKFHDRAGRGAARVEMKRLKCMLVTVLLRSHFRLLYSLSTSLSIRNGARLLPYLLAGVKFHQFYRCSFKPVRRGTKHVANLRIDFAFN